MNFIVFRGKSEKEVLSLLINHYMSVGIISTLLTAFIYKVTVTEFGIVAAITYIVELILIQRTYKKYLKWKKIGGPK